MAFSLEPNDLALWGQGKSWQDKCLDYLKNDVFELLDEGKHDEHTITEYNEELAATLGALTRFQYLARRDRDKFMAEGFKQYPKKSCNSEEQIANARNYASEADCLHKLLQEIAEVIKTRLSTGQTRANFLRDRIRNLQ